MRSQRRLEILGVPLHDRPELAPRFLDLAQLGQHGGARVVRGWTARTQSDRPVDGREGLSRAEHVALDVADQEPPVREPGIGLHRGLGMSERGGGIGVHRKPREVEMR